MALFSDDDYEPGAKKLEGHGIASSDNPMRQELEDAVQEHLIGQRITNISWDKTKSKKPGIRCLEVRFKTDNNLVYIMRIEGIFGDIGEGIGRLEEDDPYYVNGG